MRVLLAACQAAKGDVAANLDRHRELLESARARGCDLAVFPEFSLTGSVDPTRHPQHALALDARPVRDLVAATQWIGVGAVFGIAERADEGFYISQLYAHSGKLLGIYRKRHLGEDELGYRTGAEDGVFRLGAVKFGIAICAEGGVDLPWVSAARAGAPLVFFCAAPGLYGRRTDEDGWRHGHAWWESNGLGDAIRHARQHRLWVALTTQAGSTQDQDFPGLAALVSRTVRWRGGCRTGGPACWSWIFRWTSEHDRHSRLATGVRRWRMTQLPGKCDDLEFECARGRGRWPTRCRGERCRPTPGRGSPVNPHEWRTDPFSPQLATGPWHAGGVLMSAGWSSSPR